MAHGKETPRQKMIGMMYLVLTALLALNVATSVLDAFKIIDEGLEKTIKTVVNKNSDVYSDFREAYAINQSKTARWLALAQQVKIRSDSLYSYVQHLKMHVLDEAEPGRSAAIKGDTIYRDEIKATTDYDTPNRIMIGRELNEKSEATKLRKEIESYREYLLSLIPSVNTKLRASIEKSLDTESPAAKKKSGKPEERTWEFHKFSHSPLMGFLAIMSSQQLNIRNAESEVINYLYSQISAGEVKFNELEAVVIPATNYVIKGNEYIADIYLAARDTTQDPVIWIAEGVKEPWVEKTDEIGNTYIDKKEGINYTQLDVVHGSGKGVFTRPGTSTGFKQWGGIIEITGPGGEAIRRPFSGEYQVAEGGVVVSPIRMNVFYLGVDNPVEISVAGVPGSQVSAEATNGSLTPSAGKYVMRPKRLGNSMINVYVDLDGKKKNVGSKEFRVKQVPDPYATVGGKKGGFITKSELIAQTGVAAVMPPDFEFDLNFTVTEFQVLAVISGFAKPYNSRSNRFTQEQKNLFNSLSKGTPIYIQDIKAVGPDGTIRPLSTIDFKVN
ncbi:MAG: gliding motility protein GldM [Bacteroidales bacterium]|nr:gliding motility protein GldM [Bacteroidales bacterium]